MTLKLKNRQTTKELLEESKNKFNKNDFIDNIGLEILNGLESTDLKNISYYISNYFKTQFNIENRDYSINNCLYLISQRNQLIKTLDRNNLNDNLNKIDNISEFWGSYLSLTERKIDLKGRKGSKILFYKDIYNENEDLDYKCSVWTTVFNLRKDEANQLGLVYNDEKGFQVDIDENLMNNINNFLSSMDILTIKEFNLNNSEGFYRPIQNFIVLNDYKNFQVKFYNENEKDINKINFIYLSIYFHEIAHAIKFNINDIENDFNKLITNELKYSSHYNNIIYFIEEIVAELTSFIILKKLNIPINQDEELYNKKFNYIQRHMKYNPQFKSIDDDYQLNNIKIKYTKFFDIFNHAKKRANIIIKNLNK